ncbi:MAG TPA: hypothetical protein VGE07_16710 [Herpetosiphonaceae bacterium]
MRQIRKPHYVIGNQGTTISVILDLESFETLLDALEELNDLEAHEAAKAEDAAGLPFDQAVAEIEALRQGRAASWGPPRSSSVAPLATPLPVSRRLTSAASSRPLTRSAMILGRWGRRSSPARRPSAFAWATTESSMRSTTAS